MKFMLCIVILLLIPHAWLSSIKLSEKWDTTPEYVVYGPNKLMLKAGNEYKPFTGPFQAGGKLTYDIERFSARTVTAKTTRRIVQKDETGNGISRTPFYTYPAQPGTRVDANPSGKIIVSHVTVDLPPKEVLPPGKGYVIESSVEFPSKGERDATTYTSETQPFDVVP